MNAHEFLAKHGIDEAKRVLSGAPDWANFWISRDQYHGHIISFPNMTGHYSIKLSELKQVVESVEIVEQLGGIKLAKSKLKGANKSGSLLLSVRTKNGVSSIYDFKVEEAIKNWELAHE